MIHITVIQPGDVVTLEVADTPGHPDLTYGKFYIPDEDGLSLKEASLDEATAYQRRTW